MMPRLTVDGLRVDVVLSARRQTLELSVERDGALVVRAPVRASRDRLEAFVREKQAWAYRKLAAKEAIRPLLPAKEFVSGEGFSYLGRSYRLLLVAAQRTPLRLEAGRFRLLRSEARHGRAHFIRWYTEHGKVWLRPRVAAWARRVDVEPAGVEVRDLGYRWASCGRKGALNFNWSTILLPPSVVDYLIVHELIHLSDRNHTPAFWKSVERAMPDFARRRAWLAEWGAASTIFPV